MIGLFDLAFIIISIGISLIVIVPLTGVLVRFRANYNPKGLQLEADGGVSPHTGPVVHSYFGMMARVYRIEGMAGFYKGLMPTFLSTLVISIFILMAINTERPHHGAYRPPVTGALGTLFYAILMMLISLPTAVLTYRAITTPHKLTYLDLMLALRVLLTPTERRKPWILYLTPGLLMAEVSHIAIVVVVLNPLRRVLIPSFGGSGAEISDVSIIKLSLYIMVVMLSTAALAPLEIIATRLAIQRNHASSEYNSVSQEENGDAGGGIGYSGAEEDVIGLRHEGDPYLGLIDCAKKIVTDEGWSTLYRAWWITLLGGLLSMVG